ncbi:MAG TPA: HAD family phosphatase [Xanthobacteraceae bacterium]|nr:HAD family phosphatase [Xanthobacteraceae bacterium]
MKGTAYCFDLDGTLTTTEILPCIASEIGVAEEMATLTKATIEGHIPFEPSFRLRCLILGRVPSARIREIVASVPLNESIFSFIRSRRDRCYIVTGNLDIWVKPIVDSCGCGLFSSVASDDENGLKLHSVLQKSDAVNALRQQGHDRIVAVGDGMNDVPMFGAADVAIAFGGVHPPSPAAILASHYVVHDGDTLCEMLRAL